MRPPTRRTLYALALLLLTLASATHAQPQWRHVNQEVHIHPDGSTTIDLTLTAVVTEGDFGEVYLCIDHGPSICTLLPQSGVIRANSSGHALTQPCDAGTEVVVRLEQRTTEARVRLAYTLDNTVDHYSDAVQWYWNLFPTDRPIILSYRLTLTTPGPMAAPFDAHVMRYSNPEHPLVRLSADRSTLTVAFKRIPTGDGLEIRYLMDPTIFHRPWTQPGLEQLLLEQARISEPTPVPLTPPLR
jgi:hypothetical protein